MIRFIFFYRKIHPRFQVPYKWTFGADLLRRWLHMWNRFLRAKALHQTQWIQQCTQGTYKLVTSHLPSSETSSFQTQGLCTCCSHFWGHFPPIFLQLSFNVTSSERPPQGTQLKQPPSHHSLSLLFYSVQLPSSHRHYRKRMSTVHDLSPAGTVFSGISC